MAKRTNLSNKELLELDNNSLRIKEQELLLNQLNLEIEILKRNKIIIDKEIEIKQNEILKKKEKKDKEIRKSKENHEKLKKIFNVPQGKSFGYDPITGEVIYE